VLARDCSARKALTRSAQLLNESIDNDGGHILDFHLGRGANGLCVGAGYDCFRVCVGVTQVVSELEGHFRLALCWPGSDCVSRYMHFAVPTRRSSMTDRRVHASKVRQRVYTHENNGLRYHTAIPSNRCHRSERLPIPPSAPQENKVVLYAKPMGPEDFGAARSRASSGSASAATGAQ
jgi:hypothetical protein